MEENPDKLDCGCCRRESFKIYDFPEDYDDNKILVKILKKRFVKQ